MLFFDMLRDAMIAPMPPRDIFFFSCDFSMLPVAYATLAARGCAGVADAMRRHAISLFRADAMLPC